MPYIKLVKTNAYFKRFQVKFRRRREGKTDYKARRHLITQDKNKYNSPKYRLVVRFSNKDVVVQIVRATLASDVVMCAAYSHELSKYGCDIYPKGGLKNYAAAYATGLLCARRVLQKLKLDSLYQGNESIDGKHYLVEADGDSNPFYVLLDIGLVRTTTGARVFGAMKGAVDGGLNIPHKDKRFPGYSAEKKKFDSRVLRKYIFGGHVADYMRHLEAEDPEKYQKHFSKYIAAGKGADDIEAIWTSVHANIRKDPAFKKVVRETAPKKVRTNKLRKNTKQKRARVEQKKQHLLKA
jgi:large subunit ribosomal protein L5e